MPEKKTMQRAMKDKRQGKSASTQAGEFVREEMHHIREGKHGAKNSKQAIAIGLSKARRSGVDLEAPKKGTASKRTRTQAKRDLAKGKKRSSSSRRPNAKRSAGAKRALKSQPRTAASHRSLSRQARNTPRRNRTKRGASSRSGSRTGGSKRASR